MTTVAVVLPTIDGREDHLARCLHAYGATLSGRADDFEIIQVWNERNWPAACNEGMRQLAALTPPDDLLVHFTADDLVPQDGWFEAARDAIRAGYCPAPHDFDGSLHATDGPPGTICEFSRIPTLPYWVAAEVGPWPEWDYFADCWLGARLLQRGAQCRVTRGYEFHHAWAQHGRLDSPARLAEAERLYKLALAT